MLQARASRKRCVPQARGYAQKQTARATGPGLMQPLELRSLKSLRAGQTSHSTRFADGVHGPRHLRLDRLGGVGGDLGGECADLARLIGEDIELMAHVGGLQLDDLGEILGARQALGEVET